MFNIEDYIYNIQLVQWLAFARKYKCSEPYREIELSGFARFEDVKANPDINWSWYDVGKNRYTTLQDILDNPDIWQEPYGFTQNTNITFKDMRAHPEIPWSAHATPLNPNVTLQTVRDNPDYEWGNVMHMFVRNPNVSWQEITNDPLLQHLGIDERLHSPNTPPGILPPHRLHENAANKSTMRLDDVENKDALSNSAWWGFTYNKHTTWEMIQNEPRLYRNFGGVTRNPNITWKIIQDNPEYPWERNLFTHNPFTTQLKIIRERCMRRLRWAARVIERMYVRKILTNPVTRPGKRFILNGVYSDDTEMLERIQATEDIDGLFRQLGFALC